MVLSSTAASLLVVGGAVLGGAFAAISAFLVSKISVTDEDYDSERSRLNTPYAVNTSQSPDMFRELKKLQDKITDGATTFLLAEYRFLSVFVVVFSAVILFLIGPTDAWDRAAFSTLAFILGAITSVVSGWLGMQIAVYTNARTTKMATYGYAEAFITAFRGGIVMGFGLNAIGVINLFVGICLFSLYGWGTNDPYQKSKYLYGSVAAFGLGGSAIAMFGRVGGGIYTKAADVGADLVGKVRKDLKEDDRCNPGVIADNVGDNVGDIAGMGSDLFGSFAESTCATMVIAASCDSLSQSWTCMMYPLMVSSVGMVVCIITSLWATNFKPARSKAEIEPSLKDQLLISTVLDTFAIFGLSMLCLPSSFPMYFMNGHQYDVKNWYCFFAVIIGNWAGLGIGYSTEYYTSNRHSPCIECAESALSGGAATDVIFGLALGYKSAIFPACSLAVVIFVSYNLCGIFGVGLGAIGILSTMAIGLTIDAYGPISDNAGGLAEMSGLPEGVRDITDDLDAAGNTTAAIGKGYAIGSAALVSLALYGAFITRAYINDAPSNSNGTKPAVIVNIIDPRTFFGLMIGAMLPYWFSALTMRSVGMAAREMCDEIIDQFDRNPLILEYKVEPDYRRCIKIATDASLKEMIAPGLLVILSPIVFGVFFGKEALAGLLPGALVSGVQMAISASNTGGAWDNAKKYVEKKKHDFINPPGVDDGKVKEREKEFKEWKNAVVVGDTVGDPLKDTSGPALNILVKLMAIISVVFAPVVASDSVGGLLFDRALKDWTSKDA
eukprot:TRINITY_DN80119_c0_g1_i1.p2 TRINITY_DN80119_c0_g1~~TRINITY_DN80119_c0_g1_i1.p2  ORF type:complete len:780 (-),score=130.08 TRINITY_DN80119_c0_g1_i1:12-2351(-)